MGRFGKTLRDYDFARKRRKLLLRAHLSRHQLETIQDNTDRIQAGDLLVFSTIRNEAIRLPWFIDYYRKLGVGHFLFVDNNSTDETHALLADQPDISLWSTVYSYKASRFGVDWLNWLARRYAHGHWALTVDADELLIYPNSTTRPLPALTEWLESQGRESFGALMLDLYPKGSVSEQTYHAGQDPLEHLHWFDGGNYSFTRKDDLENLWGQGGVRARYFFSTNPIRSPTLTKIPLVRWHRKYAYVSSTHSALPRRLNHVYDRAGGELTSGVLLHTKFLHTIVERSAQEKKRNQHFANSALYDDYYDTLNQAPDLWSPFATRLSTWRHLEAIGLMSRGGWI